MTTNLLNRQMSLPNRHKLAQMLNDEGSFLNLIYNDYIRSGKVLLTIRPNDQVTAYYEGRQLFNLKLSDSFPQARFNRRYLPVVRSDALRKKQSNDAKTSITEADWQEAVGKKLALFEVLPEILDNLRRDSAPEVRQVSNLYKFSPLATDTTSRTVLLDIEAEFSQSGTRKSDRIDALLYHTDKMQLCFLEIKRLSDRRLWKDGKIQAPIQRQLSRYRDIIAFQSDNIAQQYNQVIETYNIINANHREIPLVDTALGIKLGLVVVGYSRMDSSDQKNFLSEASKQTWMQSINISMIGNVKNAKPETMDKWFGQ